eukprot:8424858-Lingulodinium_polyedra.AAC.1
MPGHCWPGIRPILPQETAHFTRRCLQPRVPSRSVALLRTGGQEPELRVNAPLRHEAWLVVGPYAHQ